MNAFILVETEKSLSELISSLNFLLQFVSKSKVGEIAGSRISALRGALMVTDWDVPMLKLLTSLSTVVLSASVPTTFQYIGLILPLLLLDFMIAVQLNEDGFQTLLVPAALPAATLMPRVVKSVGDVEKRILNPENVPPAVQLNPG